MKTFNKVLFVFLLLLFSCGFPITYSDMGITPRTVDELTELPNVDENVCIVRIYNTEPSGKFVAISNDGLISVIEDSQEIGFLGGWKYIDQLMLCNIENVYIFSYDESGENIIKYTVNLKSGILHIIMLK